MYADGSNDDSCLSYRRTKWHLSLGRVKAGNRGGRAPGQKVTAFSESSGRRMRRYLAECSAKYGYMGTLTVAGDDYARADVFKRAVDVFLVGFLRMQERYCNLLELKDQSIFWFVEFQARGAPHLHFFYTTPIPWAIGADLWARACARAGLDGGRGNFAQTSTKFERLRSGIRGAAAYAAKYAAKQDQKQAPSWWSGRFWGVRGCRRRGSIHEKVRDGAMSTTGRKIIEDARVRVAEALAPLVREKKVRCLAWEYGEGALWVLNCGEWADYPMLMERLVAFELLLKRYVVVCGLENEVNRGV